MTIFTYDNTFEGLLTVVFDAYARRTFPDVILAKEQPLPLFHDEVINSYTDDIKANRVWKALEKKLSRSALAMLTTTWLSEQPEAGILLFRYICKAIDAPKSIELNFGDPDVISLTKLFQKVGRERLHIIQFLRFQKAADGTFFSAVEPLYNVLPLTLEFLTDRFADQRWLIYDLHRQYGFYYDLKEVIEVRFDREEDHLLTGILREDIMDKDEKLFQQLWKQYFKATAIKERSNPKLQRQHMPVRFWKYMTEKQA